jgi:hypothetical protein
MTGRSPSPDPSPPARVAVLGPRGAGKTTLLAVLYSEAQAGRLGGYQISATDARSAAYLEDAALDLSRGVPPEPGSQPEVLHLLLQRGEDSLPILLTDGGFSAGCEAAWLCLPARAPSLDGLDLRPLQGVPLAVLLTKADELASQGPQAAREFLDPLSGHPLAGQLNRQATFVTSSTGPAGCLPDGTPVLPSPLAPSGLLAPLDWLFTTLQAKQQPTRPLPRRPGFWVAAPAAVLLAALALWAAWPPSREGPGSPPPGDDDKPGPMGAVASRAREARLEEELREARARVSLREIEDSTDELPLRLRRAEALVHALGDLPPSYEARNLLARLREAQEAAEARAREEARKKKLAESLNAYLALRDLYRADPGNVTLLRRRARECQEALADGPYARPAEEVLRYCDALERPGEYRVTLVSGVFSKKVAFPVSTGVKLSVTLEVGGERYGPSGIGSGGYYPEWSWELPRKIRWKPGDAVRIIVTDHYFWRRIVADTTYDEPGAIRYLNDSVEVGRGTLNFDTDFPFPRLPRVD